MDVDVVGVGITTADWVVLPDVFTVCDMGISAGKIPIGGDKMKRYMCIAADPPWLERGGGKIKRGADRHYDLLKTYEIIEVMLSAQPWNPDPEGSHLWLWVTNNFLLDGLHVMEALGFRYVTNMVWMKDRIGLGQYLRGQHELCLFGVRGRLPALRAMPSAFTAPRGQHSSKPREAYEVIESVSPGPRLEMFARADRPGWDVWGDQAQAVDED